MLEQILAYKREQLGKLDMEYEIRKLKQSIQDMPPVISLERSLKAGEDVSIIAEIKRRSPSRGTLNDNLDVRDASRAYESAGARAISVLTEDLHFGGSIDDLRTAKGAVTLPVLRKDFILSEFQVFESRVIGADAILLIAAALTRDSLQRLCGLARKIGLEVLIEIHGLEELEMAVNQDTNLIGINNRDLKTFRTDIAGFKEIASEIPGDIVVIAESGIRNRGDVLLLKEWGADAVLVGESIVTDKDYYEKIRELRGVSDDQD
jgi:indole-3-glycerol phosphate synthase